MKPWLCLVCLLPLWGLTAETHLTPAPNARVVVIGDSFAEQMGLEGSFESRLHQAFPAHKLVVRFQGWTGETPATPRRPDGAPSRAQAIANEAPDIILVAFGATPSPRFPSELDRLLTALRSAHPEAQIGLISPYAIPNETRVNEIRAQAVNTMRAIAERLNLSFVDLMAPSLEWRDTHLPPAHLNNTGHQKAARVILQRLTGRPAVDSFDARLLAEVQEKNRSYLTWFRRPESRYAAAPETAELAAVHMPAEAARQRRKVELRDQRIWITASGGKTPADIDDTDAGPVPKVESALSTPPDPVASPDAALERFSLAPGYTIECVASELEFPDLVHPFQLHFDGAGRLWVACAPTWPLADPWSTPDDRILVLEDRNGDQIFERSRAFARGLYPLTGFCLGDGGARAFTAPVVQFFTDPDGDLRVNDRQVIPLGLDPSNRSKALGKVAWLPSGILAGLQGHGLRSARETLVGRDIQEGAGLLRWDPISGETHFQKLTLPTNPICFTVDQYGTILVGGDNGRIVEANGMPVVQQSVPGLSALSVLESRAFQANDQGAILAASVGGGFQGIRKINVQREGTIWKPGQVMDLLRSTEPSFCPVDMSIGPDGAIYVCDAATPIIDYADWSLQDPARDRRHGRIWRIKAPAHTLKPPSSLIGKSIPQLFAMLHSGDTETRARIRLELHSRPAEKLREHLGPLIEAPLSEMQQLEILWVLQQHGQREPRIEAQLRTSQNPRHREAVAQLANEMDARGAALTIDDLIPAAELPAAALPALPEEAAPALRLGMTDEIRDAAKKAGVSPIQYLLQIVIGKHAVSDSPVRAQALEQLRSWPVQEWQSARPDIIASLSKLPPADRVWFFEILLGHPDALSLAMPYANESALGGLALFEALATPGGADGFAPALATLFRKAPPALERELSRDPVLSGRYVRIEKHNKESMVFAELEAWFQNTNRALDGQASMSSASNKRTAAFGNNGITGGHFAQDNDCIHTDVEPFTWWEVDLARERPLDKLVLWFRTDCCPGQIEGSVISILDGNRRVMFESPPVRRAGNSLTIQLAEPLEQRWRTQLLKALPGRPDVGIEVTDILVRLLDKPAYKDIATGLLDNLHGKAWNAKLAESASPYLQTRLLETPLSLRETGHWLQARNIAKRINGLLAPASADLMKWTLENPRATRLRVRASERGTLTSPMNEIAADAPLQVIFENNTPHSQALMFIETSKGPNILSEIRKNRMSPQRLAVIQKLPGVYALLPVAEAGRSSKIQFRISQPKSTVQLINPLSQEPDPKPLTILLR